MGPAVFTSPVLVSVEVKVPTFVVPPKNVILPAPVELVASVPLTVTSPVNVFSPLVVETVRLLYVPADTTCARVVALKMTVPPQVCPVGIAGLTVHCVSKFPLIVGVNAPNNCDVDIFRLAVEATVRVLLTVTVDAVVAVSVFAVFAMSRLWKVMALAGNVCAVEPVN
jgi:hypothetical protein